MPALGNSSASWLKITNPFHSYKAREEPVGRTHGKGLYNPFEGHSRQLLNLRIAFKMSRTTYRRRRAGAVWAAVLIQLHLLFVVEFHHHNTDPVRTQTLQAQVEQQATQQGANQLCPACQIARQGSLCPAPD